MNAPWNECEEQRELLRVGVPWRFSRVEEEVRAVRDRVGLSALPHWSVAEIAGDDAFDVIDALVPTDLYLREGQCKHTLFLDDGGRPVADVYVAAAEDGKYLLVVDGLRGDDLRAYCESALQSFANASFRSLEEQYTVLSINGPFAWELLAELEGPNAIGLPYLSFFRPNATRLDLRAGRTGEFGYDLIVAHEHAGALWNELLSLGARFEIARVGFAALQHCSLENWFFNIHAEGSRTRDPFTLQLQWRLSARKEFRGSEAIRTSRERADSTRIVGFEATAGIAIGTRILIDGVAFGHVVECERSITLGRYIGVAEMDRRVAHSGLGPLVCEGTGETLVTVSPPFVNNRSLFVNPQKYAYDTRDEVPFPGVERVRYRGGAQR